MHKNSVFVLVPRKKRRRPVEYLPPVDLAVKLAPDAWAYNTAVLVRLPQMLKFYDVAVRAEAHRRLAVLLMARPCAEGQRRADNALRALLDVALATTTQLPSVAMRNSYMQKDIKDLRDLQIEWQETLHGFRVHVVEAEARPRSADTHAHICSVLDDLRTRTDDFVRRIRTFGDQLASLRTSLQRALEEHLFYIDVARMRLADVFAYLAAHDPAGFKICTVENTTCVEIDGLRLDARTADLFTYVGRYTDHTTQKIAVLSGVIESLEKTVAAITADATCIRRELEMHKGAIEATRSVSIVVSQQDMERTKLIQAKLPFKLDPEDWK